MPASDSLTNLRTSQVFFELLSCPKNPKGIADTLGIKPPPVIEQLRRLQKIDIVRLGKKEGKAQNYEIVWSKFIPMFIERALKEKYTHPRRVHEDEILELSKLNKNKYFKTLIRDYLIGIADDTRKGKAKTTLDDAMREFEEGLMHSTTFKRERKFNSSEKQEFFDLIMIWRKRAEKTMTLTELNLQDAITKTMKE